MDNHGNKSNLCNQQDLVAFELSSSSLQYLTVVAAGKMPTLIFMVVLRQKKIY